MQSRFKIYELVTISDRGIPVAGLQQTHNITDR